MDEHPFRTAWRTRDAGAWAAALSPDVELWSPIVRTPFRGRDALRELYEVLFSALGDVEITDELIEGDAHAFVWRADVGRRRIQGTDVIRTGADGLVREITVFIRPLGDVLAFAAVVGPRLGAKRLARR